MKSLRPILLPLLLLSTLACNLSRFAPPTATPLPTQTSAAPFDAEKLGSTLTDITFCTADGQSLLMDMYYPEQAQGPLPVTVYVHGGAWRMGDKSSGAGYRFVEPLRRQGYLVVTINYRLSPDYKFPAHIEDVKCAIRHLRANAESYGLDPERVGAFGGSAGGHLVALLGTSDENANLEGTGDYREYSSRVQAVVDMFGPIYQSFLCNPQIIYNVFGTWDCQAEIISIANPGNSITPDDPPFLILHGEYDDVVPVNQSEILHSLLTSAGVPSELIIIQNAGHAFESVWGAPDPSITALKKIVLDFFDQHLK
ncbi:MAG: Carboxylesterase NlhH [Chloroflexi bacterium]|nr:Carboxylesterase NlhH [Chloroflexota bacterium]